MESTNNHIVGKASLKDRMTVYVGVLIILIVSWGYIIGMGWHMGTLPFIENSNMSMNMDQSMSMNDKKISILDTVLMWMPPSQGEWMFKDFFLLFIMWSVMMIAMMTPSILPMVMLFTVLNSKNKKNNKLSASPLILLIGYLVSWILFSLVITFPQYAMHKSGLLNPMMEPTHAYLGSAILILAGIYQFTPFKDACLSVCQSPLSFLMNNWKEGNLGAFLIGYKHGFYCIGCCWFLMMTLFALGVMNILWVAVLTLFVMFEKLSYRFPLLFRYSTGAIFIAWGITLTF
jgi:predicted metal-binding membrane protein|tara:strand:+ start:230 stop:1093 length:864 start_codon:yes stop_codon:yes gene_type:complete